MTGCAPVAPEAIPGKTDPDDRALALLKTEVAAMQGDGLGFRPTVGESIFSLPNGLHAYTLTNFDEDEALAEIAPNDVVSDEYSSMKEIAARQPRYSLTFGDDGKSHAERDDTSIANAASCMSCHAKGIISRKDSVRDLFEAKSDAGSASMKEKVRRLYDPQSDLDKLYADDSQRYRDAVQKIPGYTSSGDVTDRKLLKQMQAFDSDLVTLARLAAEFAVTKERILAVVKEITADDRKGERKLAAELRDFIASPEAGGISRARLEFDPFTDFDSEAASLPGGFTSLAELIGAKLAYPQLTAQAANQGIPDPPP